LSFPKAVPEEAFGMIEEFGSDDGIDFSDHVLISSASFSGIPSESRNSWWASGARFSNSACQQAMDRSSMPADRSIPIHMAVSTTAGTSCEVSILNMLSRYRRLDCNS